MTMTALFGVGQAGVDKLEIQQALESLWDFRYMDVDLHFAERCTNVAEYGQVMFELSQHEHVYFYNSKMIS